METLLTATKEKSLKEKSVDAYLSHFKIITKSMIEANGDEENACEFYFKEIYAFYADAIDKNGCLFANFPISRISTCEKEAQKRTFNEAFAFVKHFDKYFKTYSNIKDKSNKSFSYIEFMNTNDGFKYKKFFSLPEGMTQDNEVVDYFKREISKRLLFQTDKLTQKKRST